jgi:hypothetical protein
MKRIIFVVGHESWGKSLTLRHLTDNSRHIKNYEIGGTNWFIRRMSNDDRPDGYYEFMQKLDPSIKPNLIAAFCPNFDEKRFDVTVKILNSLKAKGYNLHFWVLQHQFSTKAKIISSYIDELRKYGDIEIYSKTEEANIRSQELKAFVAKYA